MTAPNLHWRFGAFLILMITLSNGTRANDVQGRIVFLEEAGTLIVTDELRVETIGAYQVTLKADKKGPSGTISTRQSKTIDASAGMLHPGNRVVIGVDDRDRVTAKLTVSRNGVTVFQDQRDWPEQPKSVPSGEAL